MSFRVLLLEDDDLVRRLFARHLRRRGCVVWEVATVQEALDTLPEAAPNVITSDVMLVGETGLDLFNRLSPTLQQRVIFVTGYAGFAREELALTGCPVLYKPFQLEELWAVIHIIAGG